MGLNDRDYMREVPIYEELVGRRPLPPPPRLTDASGVRAARLPRRSRRLTLIDDSKPTRAWAWFLLGAIATLAVVAHLAQQRGTSPSQPTPIVQLPTVPPPPQPQFQVVPAPT